MGDIDRIRGSGRAGKGLQELHPLLSRRASPVLHKEGACGGNQSVQRISIFKFLRTGKSAWVSHLSGPCAYTAGEIIGVIATGGDITGIQEIGRLPWASEANLANRPAASPPGIGNGEHADETN